MPYSNLHSLTAPPLGFTVALSVAVVCATADAAPVSARGGYGSVLNVPSRPLLVPPGLVAEILKWYAAANATSAQS